MSHTLKLLDILHQRICRRLEEDISKTQFGFRKGTQEALFGINVPYQRCLNINQEGYMHVTSILNKHLIMSAEIFADDDYRIICNLYWDQKATAKVENQPIEEIEIRRGVRQRSSFQRIPRR